MRRGGHIQDEGLSEERHLADVRARCPNLPKMLKMPTFPSERLLAPSALPRGH